MAEKKPKIRFRGFEDEWEDTTLVEKGEFKSNGVDKKIRPQEKSINLLNYMDVYNHRHVNAQNCDELMQVTATERQIKENNVESGDVFFTPSSETAEDIGHVAVIEETLPNTCYSYHLMRFRPYPGVFYTTFPNYSFASKQVRKQLVLEAQGVQRFVLRKEKFEAVTVSIPHIDEQKKIADLFNQLDELIGAKEQELEKLRQLKLALLEKMFPNADDATENRGGV